MEIKVKFTKIIWLIQILKRHSSESSIYTKKVYTYIHICKYIYLYTYPYIFLINYLTKWIIVYTKDYNDNKNDNNNNDNNNNNNNNNNDNNNNNNKNNKNGGFRPSEFVTESECEITSVLNGFIFVVDYYL